MPGQFQTFFKLGPKMQLVKCLGQCDTNSIIPIERHIFDTNAGKQLSKAATDV